MRRMATYVHELADWPHFEWDNSKLAQKLAAVRNRQGLLTGRMEELDCLDRAFDGAETILASVFKKARFWKKHAGETLNERQRAMIDRLLNGFEGKLTSSKWAKIAKCSQDTALRDVDDLIAKGILTKDAAGGRSTSYSLVDEETGTEQ
jgi:Fic family protein